MKWKILITLGLIALTGIVVLFVFRENLIPMQKEMLEIPGKKEEIIEGKEEAKIIYWKETTGEEWARIEYHEGGGKKYSGYFIPEVKNALDWIKKNTEETSIFFCWWEYGHMIKGYTGREVIARFPSKEWTASHPGKQLGYLDPNGTLQIGYEPDEIIRDIILALTTKDEEMFLSILGKYNVSYVFIYKGYENIFGYKIGGYSEIAEIFKAVDLEPEKYLIEVGGEKFNFTELGKETMIARLTENREIKGLSLVYSDEFTNIYQIR